MKKGWSKVAFEEVFDLDLDSVNVDASASYQMVGVLSYGRGLFGKPPVAGTDKSYKTFYRLHPGQIVVSQLFGWEGAIAPVTSGFEGFFVSSQFPTFRPKANLDTGFARWLVRNPKVWEQLKAAAKGMGDRRRTLSPDIFLNVTSLLPPLAEQQRIVAHLDAIEARITRVQKLREEAAAEVAALFPKLLGEAVTPHGEGWKRETVTDVIESMDAGWSPQCDDIPAREGEWGVLKTTSVQWGNFQPKYNKALPSELVAVPSLAVKKGDVLVTRAGPRKRVAVVAAVRRNEPKLTISDKIIRLRANRARIHPRFLELSLASPFSQEHLVQRKTGLADAQVNISQSILRATPVAYPALNEQERIIAELEASRSSIDELAKGQEAARAETAALLPSLLDCIFNP